MAGSTKVVYLVVYLFIESINNQKIIICINSNLEPNVSYQINTAIINNSQLVIVYINMRSIVRRWSKFEYNIASMKIVPDEIVITETWIYEDEAEFYNLEGFSSFHSTRPRIQIKSRGDGTTI